MIHRRKKEGRLSGHFWTSTDSMSDVKFQLAELLQRIARLDPKKWKHKHTNNFFHCFSPSYVFFSTRRSSSQEKATVFLIHKWGNRSERGVARVMCACVIENQKKSCPIRTMGYRRQHDRVEHGKVLKRVPKKAENKWTHKKGSSDHTLLIKKGGLQATVNATHTQFGTRQTRKKRRTRKKFRPLTQEATRPQFNQKLHI